MWLNRTNTFFRPSAVRVDKSHSPTDFIFSCASASTSCKRRFLGFGQWVLIIGSSSSQVAATITSRFRPGLSASDSSPRSVTPVHGDNPQSKQIPAQHQDGESSSLFPLQGSAAHSTRNASARGPFLANSHHNLRTSALSTLPSAGHLYTKTVAWCAQASCERSVGQFEHLVSLTPPVKQSY